MNSRGRPPSLSGMRGNLTGIDTPPQFHIFKQFIVKHHGHTCNRVLVDQLTIKTARGMYVAPYKGGSITVHYTFIISITGNRVLVDCLAIKATGGMYLTPYECRGVVVIIMFQ